MKFFTPADWFRCCSLPSLCIAMYFSPRLPPAHPKSLWLIWRDSHIERTIISSKQTTAQYNMFLPILTSCFLLCFKYTPRHRQVNREGLKYQHWTVRMCIDVNTWLAWCVQNDFYIFIIYSLALLSPYIEAPVSWTSQPQNCHSICAPPNNM